MIPAPTQKDPLIKLLYYTNGSIIINWEEWLKERNMVSWEYIRKAPDVDGVGVRVDFLRKYNLSRDLKDAQETWLDSGKSSPNWGNQHVQSFCCQRQPGRFKELREDRNGLGVREGKGVRNWRKGIYCKTEDTLRNTLSTLLIILIFDLRVLGCHQTVLNSGIMMGSVLCFEKYVGLLLSREWTRLKAERPVRRLLKRSRRPIPCVRLGH